MNTFNNIQSNANVLYTSNICLTGLVLYSITSRIKMYGTLPVVVRKHQKQNPRDDKPLFTCTETHI